MDKQIGTLGVEPRLTRYKQAALTIKLCPQNTTEPRCLTRCVFV